MPVELLTCKWGLSSSLPSAHALTALSLLPATHQTMVCQAVAFTKTNGPGASEPSLAFLRQDILVHVQLSVGRHLELEDEVELNAPVLLGLFGSAKTMCSVRTSGDHKQVDSFIFGQGLSLTVLANFIFGCTSLSWRLSTLSTHLLKPRPLVFWQARSAFLGGEHVSFVLFRGKLPENEPVLAYLQSLALPFLRTFGISPEDFELTRLSAFRAGVPWPTIQEGAFRLTFHKHCSSSHEPKYLLAPSLLQVLNQELEGSCYQTALVEDPAKIILQVLLFRSPAHLLRAYLDSGPRMLAVNSLDCHLALSWGIPWQCRFEGQYLPRQALSTSPSCLKRFLPLSYLAERLLLALPLRSVSFSLFRFVPCPFPTLAILKPSLLSLMLRYAWPSACLRPPPCAGFPPRSPNKCSSLLSSLS